MTKLTLAEVFGRILEKQNQELRNQMLAEGWLYCKGPKRRPYYRRGPRYKPWPEFTSVSHKHWRKLNGGRPI